MQRIIQKLKIKFIIFAAFSALCCFMVLEIFPKTPVLQLLYGVVWLLLVLILAIFYHDIDALSAGQREYGRLYAVVPAMLFTFFMTFGYSFLHDGSWNLVVNADIGQLGKTAIMAIGYFLFFYYMVAWVYDRMDSSAKVSVKSSAYHRVTPIRKLLGGGVRKSRS